MVCRLLKVVFQAFSQREKRGFLFLVSRKGQQLEGNCFWFEAQDNLCRKLKTMGKKWYILVGVAAFAWRQKKYQSKSTI